MTRRITGPILAACGAARVVVPQSLAEADKSSDGAIISKGLRRSWFEKFIDSRIKADRYLPPSSRMGVFAIPRGALARAATVTFPDAEWQQGVTDLLRVADAAVIDVTDVSESVRFEVSTALAALPRDRVVFLCEKRKLDRFDELLEQRGERISDFPHVVCYTPGYVGRISLRWRLCRLVRAFR